MSNSNPYQAPSSDAPPEVVRIAKTFSYEKTPDSKGIIFHGAIFASEEGLFICHDKHTRKSAGTAAATFGLIGVAVNYFMTRNKTFEYPFGVLPADELPDSIRNRLTEHKFKEKSVVSIIPIDEIDSFSASFTQGKKFKIGEIELQLIAPVKKGLKELESMGYNVD